MLPIPWSLSRRMNEMASDARLSRCCNCDTDCCSSYVLVSLMRCFHSKHILTLHASCSGAAARRAPECSPDVEWNSWGLRSKNSARACKFFWVFSSSSSLNARCWSPSDLVSCHHAFEERSVRFLPYMSDLCLPGRTDQSSEVERKALPSPTKQRGACSIACRFDINLSLKYENANLVPVPYVMRSEKMGRSPKS